MVSKPQSLPAMTRCGSPIVSATFLQSLGDHLRMLDEGGGGIDHARNDDLVLAIRSSDPILVARARVGERARSRRPWRVEERDDVLQPHVEVVRAFIIAQHTCSRTRSGGMSWIAALIASTTRFAEGDGNPRAACRQMYCASRVRDRDSRVAAEILHPRSPCIRAQCRAERAKNASSIG